MDIHITYDKKLLFGGIKPTPWAQLGPEKWFDQYVVVTGNSRGFTADFVRNLNLSPLATTSGIINTPEFEELASGKLADYRFITYKPMTPPVSIHANRFVAQNSSYKRFEDKKIFRDIFADSLPIPRFFVIPTDDFLSRMADEVFTSYSKLLGQKFVVQDNRNSAGRGTFIVGAESDVSRCQETLVREQKGTHIVISEYIDGIERSMQVFVSKADVVKGPLQQQLVRNPLLLDPDKRGGIYFCGGQLITQYSKKVNSQIEIIIATASDTLRREGYAGIFGVDFIVDVNENVYILEINARPTALLPLLNQQSMPLPLYLLHMLELSGESYTITKHNNSPIRGPRTLLVLSNTTNAPVTVDQPATTGNYQFKDGSIKKLDENAEWNEQADFMLQVFSSPAYPVAPHAKLANIFLAKRGFDDQGTLNERAITIIEYVRSHSISKM